MTHTRVYYPAGGVMRVDGTLYYVLKDQLGSASVVTNSSGNTVGEQRYNPFGDTRVATGSMFTDKLFTGQRQIASLGIYQFGARFYDPTVGRFIQPDINVPGVGNPQAFNRYSYVLNNPVNLTDPSGYKPCWASKKYSCDLSSWTQPQADAAVANYSAQAQPAVVAFFQNQGVPVTPLSTSENGGGGGNATTTGSVATTAGGGTPTGGSNLVKADLQYSNRTINARYVLQPQPPSSGPSWGRYLAGSMLLIAGAITIGIGVVVMASAGAEIAVGTAAAPETFGLSEVMAILHAPAEFAVGGMTATAGAAFSYEGAKLMWKSGVYQSVFETITSAFK